MLESEKIYLVYRIECLNSCDIVHGVPTSLSPQYIDENVGECRWEQNTQISNPSREKDQRGWPAPHSLFEDKYRMV